MLSPYMYSGLVKNSWERILRELHFDQVYTADGPALRICATNVRSGKIKLFQGDEIKPTAIMAPACLPSLFEAVEIEDPDT